MISRDQRDRPDSCDRWSSPSRIGPCRHELWKGQGEQALVVADATVLPERIACALVRLPLALPVQCGEALVVQRRWVEPPRLHALVSWLRQRLQPWADRHAELEILP